MITYRGFAGHVHWYVPIAYLKHLHPRIDKVVCNSKAVEKMFHRQLFFDRSKTVVITKGHDSDWYSHVQPRDLTDLGIPRDAPVVCCLTNARKFKGIQVLLKVIRLLNRQSNIHFLLIGCNLDTPDKIKILEDNVQKDRVHFIGYLKEPYEYIAASNVMVLPSLYGESLTKAVLEAMCLCVAPTITDIAGNAELLVHEESGLKVTP